MTSTTFPAYASKEIAWISVVGPGVCRESGRFEALLEQVVRKGHTTLVLDLLKCPRMDSTFVGTLLRLAQLNSSAPNAEPLRIILNHCGPQIRELIETLCLEPYFELADLEAPAQLDTMAVEERTLSQEEIMSLSLDGHERLSALNSENAGRFASLLGVLRSQLGAARAPGTKAEN